MMENPKGWKKNITKDRRTFFRLKKDIRNLFRLEKETKAIKDRMIKDIRNLCWNKEEEESYYKPVRVNNFWSNSYIEYESNSDRNETLPLKNILINVGHI